MPSKWMLTDGIYQPGPVGEGGRIASIRQWMAFDPRWCRAYITDLSVINIS